MTATITSSLRIGIVAGTGVRIAGPVVPEITTDDIFNADNPTQTLTELIGGLSSTQLVGTATLDGTTIANTTIYTVPANETFIPTSVVFLLTDITGEGVGPAINVGFSGSYQELIDSTRSTGYTLSSASSISDAGSGYSEDDILTLTGGTFDDVATITVDSVGEGGVVLTFHISAIGSYTEIPTNPVACSGGDGGSFKLTAVWDLTGGLLADINTVGQILNVSDLTTTAGSDGLDYEYLTGGDVLKARVAFPSTYDDYTIKCFVFGFLTQV